MRKIKSERGTVDIHWVKRPTVVDDEIRYTLERKIYMDGRMLDSIMVMGNCTEQAIEEYVGLPKGEWFEDKHDKVV